MVMMQLDSLNFLTLGGKFQIQKISIVLVIILVEQLFKMTTNLDFCAKWLHGLKDGTIAKYQIVKNYSQLKHPFLQRTRSSHPEVYLRKGVLKICYKFTGKHSCRSAFQ